MHYRYRYDLLVKCLAWAACGYASAFAADLDTTLVNTATIRCSIGGGLPRFHTVIEVLNLKIMWYN